MEVHRLKNMPDGYDVPMFNRLYSRTIGLRKKLASEINPHRFNLQYDDILSWFDDKVIWVFSKYHSVYDEDVLLGHIINSLQLFKCRILRAAYTHKYSQQIINIENPGQIEDIAFTDPRHDDSLLYNKLVEFLKLYITDDAVYLLEIQLNPPPYILKRLNSSPDKKLDKISDNLLIEYLDMPQNEKALRYITGLKKEIKEGVAMAKQRFNSKNPTL